jgi:hypothetical protein
MVVIEELPGSSSVMAGPSHLPPAPPVVNDPRGGAARAARGSSPARLSPLEVPPSPDDAGPLAASSTKLNA